MPNLTLPDLQRYIESLARLNVRDEPYSIDLTDGLVTTATREFQILIPEDVIKVIKLEEL